MKKSGRYVLLTLLLLALAGAAVSWAMWVNIEGHYRHDPYGWPNTSVESDANRAIWIHKRNEFALFLVAGASIAGSSVIAGLFILARIIRNHEKQRKNAT